VFGIRDKTQIVARLSEFFLMMLGMASSANLSVGNASNAMENAAPKKFVLLVQPQPLRCLRFMDLYRSGFVAQWAKDVQEARKVMARIFDVVVVDLNFEPQRALAFCREVKRREPARLVIGLGAVEVALDPCLDLVLPPGAPGDELIRLLGGLRFQTRRAG
jgi:CheY-like chemotaxis protein